MSGAAGTWDVTTSSVIGDMRYVVTLAESVNGWIAGLEGDAGGAEIRDLIVSGDRLSLTLRVTRPAAADFDILARIVDDTMTGSAKAKFLPEAQLVGHRRVEGAPAPVQEPEDDASAQLAADLARAAAPTIGGIAPGLQDFGRPVTPDTVALEFELPPPPPAGIAPAPPPPAD